MTPTLLVIDIGNSGCRCAYGPAGESFSRDSVFEVSHSDMSELKNRFGSISACVVSSVHAGRSSQIRTELRGVVEKGKLFFLNSRTSPLELLVASPETLGPDRIAAAHAAYLRSQGSCIIVDTGTAVTIDSVNQVGQFEGGVIFPGKQLDLDALATRTDQLPQIKLSDDPPALPGRDTRSAIAAGVFWSHVGAIEKVVSRYLQARSESDVFLTGGGSSGLQDVLEIDAGKLERVPSLVLEGLWAVGQKRLNVTLG